MSVATAAVAPSETMKATLAAELNEKIIQPLSAPVGIEPCPE
jgi:hypothetical protein